MTREANLHELTREALAEARELFPDAIVDIEHRGDGECEIEPPFFSVFLSGVLVWALAARKDGESVWVRSSGVDPSVLTVDVRWTGVEPSPMSWEGQTGAAARVGLTLERSSNGRERHVRLSLPRHA
jgi:hypothetical protein